MFTDALAVSGYWTAIVSSHSLFWCLPRKSHADIPLSLLSTKGPMLKSHWFFCSSEVITQASEQFWETFIHLSLWPHEAWLFTVLPSPTPSVTESHPEVTHQHCVLGQGCPEKSLTKCISPALALSWDFCPGTFGVSEKNKLPENVLYRREMLLENSTELGNWLCQKEAKEAVVLFYFQVLTKEKPSNEATGFPAVVNW